MVVARSITLLSLIFILLSGTVQANPIVYTVLSELYDFGKSVAGDVAADRLSSYLDVGEEEKFINEAQASIENQYSRGSVDRETLSLALKQIAEVRVLLLEAQRLAQSNSQRIDGIEERLSRLEERVNTSRNFDNRSAHDFVFLPNGVNESQNGFACSNSSMPMDFVICSFQEVYDVNTLHAVAWYITMDKLTKSEKSGLVNSQRAWINNMLSQCSLPNRGRPSRYLMESAAPCVHDSYVERTRFIRRYSN